MFKLKGVFLLLLLFSVSHAFVSCSSRAPTKRSDNKLYEWVCLPGSVYSHVLIKKISVPSRILTDSATGKEMFIYSSSVSEVVGKFKHADFLFSDDEKSNIVFGCKKKFIKKSIGYNRLENGFKLKLISEYHIRIGEIVNDSIKIVEDKKIKEVRGDNWLFFVYLIVAFILFFFLGWFFKEEKGIVMKLSTIFIYLSFLIIAVCFFLLEYTFWPVIITLFVIVILSLVAFGYTFDTYRKISGRLRAHQVTATFIFLVAVGFMFNFNILNFLLIVLYAFVSGLSGWGLGKFVRMLMSFKKKRKKV